MARAATGAAQQADQVVAVGLVVQVGSDQAAMPMVLLAAPVMAVRAAMVARTILQCQAVKEVALALEAVEMERAAMPVAVAVVTAVVAPQAAGPARTAAAAAVAAPVLMGQSSR